MESVRAERDQQLDLDRLFHPWETRALRALIGMHEARTGAMAAAIEHEERVGRQYCQVCGVAVTRGSLLCRAHYPRRVAGLESSEKQKFEKQKAKI